MKNLGNRVTHIENMALVYAITNLDGYRHGRSTLQEYYFPIRSLSEAINASDDLVDVYEEDAGLTF